MLLVISPASLLRATALSSRSVCLCRGLIGLGCSSHTAAPEGTNNTEAIRQTWAPECTVKFSWMNEFLHEPGVRRGGLVGEGRVDPQELQAAFTVFDVTRHFGQTEVPQL